MRKLLVLSVALALTPRAFAGGPRLPLLATVPADFSDAFFVTGLSAPVSMDFAPDGRLFVCEKAGSLRIVSSAGTLLPTPFMTLTVDNANERGLLGIAFDPQFATNGFLYCYYTVPGSPPHNRVSRFTADGDVAVPGSETPILDLEDLQTGFHNGGAMQFGADGKLYVAVGENGLSSYGQQITNRLGKILRINSDGTIPNDNPASFPGIPGTTSGVNRSVWCVGLRNPFTFAVQPGTGRMFINDVGNATWEEIDDGIAGSNYGWPTTEGDFDSATWPNFRRPIHTYTHDGAAMGTGQGEAICGGTFYPVGGSFPAVYHGKYFYADLTNNWIRVLDPADNSTSLFATGLQNTVNLKIGPDGALYYLSHTGGRVGRIAYLPVGTAPSITIDPADRAVGVGQSAAFSVSASGTAPLSYQWQRNGVDIGGATSVDYTLSNAQLADDGAAFRCVVANGYGAATSAAATLTVTANQPPVPILTSPPAGTTYTAGDVIVYAGTGSDPEDGTLPAGSFTWRVDFHHHTHVHPFVPDTAGATGGQFAIPTSGETDSDVWYRITLTVVDSGGLTTSVTRDIVPIVSTVTLTTDPPGLQVMLDGTPQTAPYVFQGVAGMVRTIEVASPQTSGGASVAFGSWDDGGARSHAISTPPTDTVYTATFQAAASGAGGGGGGACGLVGLEALAVLAWGAARRRKRA